MPENKQTHTLFKRYAQDYALAFDEAIEASGQGDAFIYGDEIMELARNSTANRLQNWFSEPLAELDGQSGKAYLEQLDEEALFEAFKVAAVELPDELPDSFKIILGRHWQALVPKLEEAALRVSWQADDADEAADDELVIASEAIVLLGEWRVPGFVERFLDQFLAVERPQENIADAGRRYFSALAEDAAAPLLHRLRLLLDQKQLSPASDYLLIYLTEWGKLEQDEAIYHVLRGYFRIAADKSIAAICLGDYGDGRAVTLLRGWISNHGDELSRAEYYEILSAITRLGGTHQDLPKLYRDFDGGYRQAADEV